MNLIELWGRAIRDGEHVIGSRWSSGPLMDTSQWLTSEPIPQGAWVTPLPCSEA